jgi:hypothetical protein
MNPDIATQDNADPDPKTLVLIASVSYLVPGIWRAVPGTVFQLVQRSYDKFCQWETFNLLDCFA